MATGEQQRTIRIGDSNVPYTVVRTRRRRRTVAFAVDPGPVVTVRAPARATFQSIEELALEHAGWIQRRIDELDELGITAEPRRYVTGEQILYLGVPQALEVVPALGLKARCVLAESGFRLELPLALAPAKAVAAAETAVMAWFRKRAQGVFAERVQVWQEKLKVTPGKIFVTNPQHRWGSCDARNNIRLNWRILMAPVELLDYVVAHELAHVVHKNHGPRFWRKLEKAMPDYRERRDALRLGGHEYAL